MIGTRELTTYCSDVPGIDAYCGAPSKDGVNLGPFTREMVAVCGIVFAIIASSAWGVPATEASTTPAGSPFGMRLKSGGSASAATNVHGPPRPDPVYQRPQIRTSSLWVVGSMRTSADVLLGPSSLVPVTGTKLGGPLKMISSLGVCVTWIVGTPLASDGFGTALGPPVRRSTAPLFASCCAVSSS